VKRLKRVKAEGRVAVTSNPTDNLIAKRQHCRSMMLSMQLRIYCDNCRSIVHHRLWRPSSHGADKNLLTGLQWITTKLLIGDGTSSREMCNLGTLELDVPFVPSLDRNLISVSSNPHTTEWELDKYGATLQNQERQTFYKTVFTLSRKAKSPSPSHD
jgi:hypothetical protein